MRGEIGTRLAYVRGRESQAAFATKVGIHKNSLGNYERGEREIGAEALRGYVAMGWNANWLLTGEGPERLDAMENKGIGSQSPRQEDITLAAQLTQEALDGATLEPADYGQLFGLIYDALVHGLPSARVLALAKPAARGISRGTVDANTVVGGSGKGVAGAR